MGTVTYSNVEVIQSVSQNFLPWRVSVLEQQEIVDRFLTDWTPCVIILDSKGQEHHRFVGFLSPREFLAQLNLGLARIAFHEKDFSKAAELFNTVVQKFPETSAVPEAIWYRGISRFQVSADRENLNATRIELQEKYPQSIWGEKASAWGT